LHARQLDDFVKFEAHEVDVLQINSFCGLWVVADT
jgi:hypothetical protein